MTKPILSLVPVDVGMAQCMRATVLINNHISEISPICGAIDCARWTVEYCQLLQSIFPDIVETTSRENGMIIHQYQQLLTAKNIAIVKVEVLR